MSRWGLLLTLLSLGGFGVLGCGGDSPGPINPVPTDGGVDTKTGGSEAQKPETPKPGGPEQAVRAVLEGVRDGQALPIWTFLPSRYQQAINQLIRDFAGKMDAAVWDRTFVSLKRLVDVIRSKKNLLINNPGLPLRQIDQKQLDENWPALVGLFETLLTSELKEVKTLKTFDGKEFFAGTGTTFLQQLRTLSASDSTDPLKQLASSKITVVEVIGGDRARLQIGSSSTGDEPSPTRQFILIDERWFPSELAADLDELLRLGRTSVKAMPEAESDASRQRWLAILDALDNAAATLEKADTAESFNKALADAQLAVIPLLATSGNDQPRSSNVRTSITVVLQGAMDEKARRDHIAALRVLAKGDDAPDVTSSNDATTVILTTTQSIQSIVDGIKFGKVTRIDERKRTITVVPGQLNKPGS